MALARRVGHECAGSLSAGAQMSVASVRPCARSLRLVPLVLVLPCIAAAQSSDPTQPGPAQVPPPSATAAPAPAPAPHPSQWSGKPYSWASFGTTFAYGQTYANANVGVGWLMRNGIAPNVEVGYAFGNSPTLWTLRAGGNLARPRALARRLL